MKKNHTISQEAIGRYIRGESSLEEMAVISIAMKEDEDFCHMVTILDELQNNEALEEDDGTIPMASMAAISEGNLCDVMCEQYILKDYLGPKAAEDYRDEALDNCWLKESGTPLHSMGHLLENHGMRVSRQYDCSLEELTDKLGKRYKVITVVDYGQLWNQEADGILHAVVCLNVVDGVIRIFDPAIDGHGNYSVEAFVKAWNYSRNYLVCASADGLDYVPHPIDVKEVTLDDDLMELSEALAENAHEIWANKRRSEGWTYGPRRDDVRLQHPDMIPYYELPESEKYYDRDMAMHTIRLVKKLGFNISRRLTAYCPHCGEFVADTMHFCPNCGKQLSDNN